MGKLLDGSCQNTGKPVDSMKVEKGPLQGFGITWDNGCGHVVDGYVHINTW